MVAPAAPAAEAPVLRQAPPLNSADRKEFSSTPFIAARPAVTIGFSLAPTVRAPAAPVLTAAREIAAAAVTAAAAPAEASAAIAAAAFRGRVARAVAGVGGLTADATSAVADTASGTEGSTATARRASTSPSVCVGVASFRRPGVTRPRTGTGSFTVARPVRQGGGRGARGGAKARIARAAACRGRPIGPA